MVLLDVTATISIHAPLTGSDRGRRSRLSGDVISIHAPLTGSDQTFLTLIRSITYFNPRSPYGERLVETHKHRISTYFNPRSPYGERPRSRFWPFRKNFISIHAPLTGSDTCRIYSTHHHTDFNPRSPYGERPGFLVKIPDVRRFQSTLPLRGATAVRGRFSDVGNHFNPRSPYGERPET